jgi:hypothetical protein
MSRNAILIALAALLGTPAALAGQPVSQTLTPPPLPDYVCKAVGSGTICQAVRDESYGPVGTGIACGSGATAFEIFDRGVLTERAIRFYDLSGNLTRRAREDVYSLGEFSNPLTGAAVPYTQHNVTVDVLAVPGDLGSATETTTGENIYRPAHASPVFLNAGRTVFGADGTLEFRSGSQNFLDYFVDGDTSVLDPLCAALGAA